ncbi:hypothetical protein G5V59_25235 [Nocardioides sp. W3-2-3]|nr:hypothetical protein [Nocardioides convexus]
MATLVAASGLATVSLSTTPAHADPVVKVSAAKDGPRDKARRSADALVRSRAPQLKASRLGQTSPPSPSSAAAAACSSRRTSASYKGLDVRGGDFVVVTNKDGQILGTSVAQKRAIGNLSVAPKCSPPERRAPRRRRT